MMNLLRSKKNTDKEKTGSSVDSDSGFAEAARYSSGSSLAEGSSSSSGSSTSLPKLDIDQKRPKLTQTRQDSTSTLSSTSSSVKDLDDTIEERVNTFLNEGWIHLVSVQDLSEAGFECKGKDVVGCVRCGVQISAWKAGDIPLKRHIKESPKCSFAKYKRKQSKKKRKSNLQFDSRQPSGNEDSSDEFENDDMEVFSREFNRLVTFEEWPLSSPVDRYDLAAAGFYRASPSSDVVQCYACDVKVKEWNIGDRPKKKHDQLNPKCPHLKGKETSGNKPLHSSEKKQAVNISIRNN